MRDDGTNEQVNAGELDRQGGHLADIFLSYAREDTAFAETLVHAFERRGWSVFWDKTIPAGKQWNDFLKSQLQRARCVVVLWSDQSATSEWVLHESSVALHRGTLVPVLLDPVFETNGKLAAVFGAVQSVSWIGSSGAGGANVQEVVRAISTRIGRPRKWPFRTVAAAAILLLAVKGSAWLGTSEQFLADAQREHRNQNVMRIAGVKWVSWGPFDSDENAREFALVRDARSIDLIVTNANQFATNFRPYLKTFFSRPDSRMRVIFSSVETPFYQQMVRMTGMFHADERALKADMGKVDTSRRDLLSDVSDSRQIEFRYYDTQYRMPIILIDGKYCIVTVRLPPDEGQESLRLEADDSGPPTSASSAGSAPKPRLLPHVGQSCQAHFERLWGLSAAQPVSYPLAATAAGRTADEQHADPTSVVQR